MKDQNHHRALLGLGLNIFCATGLLLGTFSYYEKWDSVKTPADIRLATDEEVLRDINYLVFPGAAVGMMLSAFWFWKLRK
jgi:hypothetical protein